METTLSALYLTKAAMRCITAALLFSAASQAWAGEISGFGGMVYDSAKHARKLSWQLEYREELSEHLGGSFTYLNEGHLPDHHRDGQAVQLWAGDTLLDRRLSLSVGAGPYLYCDTTPGKMVKTEVDLHGLGLLSTLAATWHLDDRLLLQMRINGVVTVNSFDTYSALVGLGYQLDTLRSDGLSSTRARQPRSTPRNEFTLFLGETNVFNDGSSHSAAAAVEYRAGVLPNLDWSATLLYEGENDLIRRRGVATQLWATKSFLGDLLYLGVGAGPYLAFDGLATAGEGGRDLFLLANLTMTSAYRFHPDWNVRFSWNRVITRYDRDADVWLWGIGYLF